MGDDGYDPEDNARKCYDLAIATLRERLVAAMTPKMFLDDRVALHEGDCLEVVSRLPDASVDSVVTDPPYALVSIAKRLGAEGSAPIKPEGMGGAYARVSAGFMGKQWDNGQTAFAVEFWRQVLRVLKPGGHVVAFGGTRTYHRLACAIEDAGFEIRDQIGWAYGSGFPKSHNVSKAIDRHLGSRDAKVTVNADAPAYQRSVGNTRPWMDDPNHQIDGPDAATPEAAEWDGWGTALKPAWEPIVLARKPLIGTVAESVLRHGTGALNIDGCRIEGEPRRWPANIIHDGSDEALALFPHSASGNGAVKKATGDGHQANAYGKESRPSGTPMVCHGDEGSAARFFYSSKADGEDRLGSKHPTVKPLDLMQWLVRLVTPKGGITLDPFGGTGTTGEAAWREGMRAILIEREPEYQADIARRMELAANPTKRAAVAKTKNNLDKPEDLPLFAARN